MTTTADRNLLFGIVALQMDFISRDALITAMNAWVLAKQKPLGQVLVGQGDLKADEHALLEALVEKHLQRHGGDTEQSLAALTSAGMARQQLERIADPDVQASIACISPVTRADSLEHTDYCATRAESSAELPGRREPWSGSDLASQRFRILRPHARGGLGEVFLARDEEVRREVALKQIQDRHADDLGSRARFLREAEITGSLEHPGIVPVYGLGQYADGRPFYAMRFIKGDSLAAAIDHFHEAGTARRRPGERALQLRQLLSQFIDVCNAIEYAHSRGVLHRDLKPGNIMLGKFGETLVVDWGLAKALSRQDDSPADETSVQPSSVQGTSETVAGSVIGTPQYMSPEQAAGTPDCLGPASDVYSLGATLYCVLTGAAPFTDKDVGAVLSRVQQGVFPSPREVNREVPPALAAICLKAMALSPKLRYPSPRALSDDIEHWLADESVSAYPDSLYEKLWRWVRRHRALFSWTLLAVLVLLLSLFALMMISEGAKDTQTRVIKGVQSANLAMARFAARQIENRMRQRWTTLEQAAADPEFQKALSDVRAEPGDPAARDKLESWLQHRRETFRHLGFDDRWFVIDDQGCFLGMAPRGLTMPEPRQHPFWARDYFHGLGTDLRDDVTPAAAPPIIQKPHKSVVFQTIRGDSQFLTVFSVPIRNRSEPTGRPLGVLAMGVRLGMFSEISTPEDDPDSPVRKWATLVQTREHAERPDARSDRIPNEGLILEHPLIGKLVKENEGRNLAETVPRIYLAREQLATLRTTRQSDDYRDPMGALSDEYQGRCLAAVEPVRFFRRVGGLGEELRLEDYDSGWLVVIQADYDRAVQPVQTFRAKLISRGAMAVGGIVGLVVLLWCAALLMRRGSART